MSEEAVVEPKAPIDLAEEKVRPRVVALLFFDYANQTADGKLNLAGVFDRIFVDRDAKKTVPFGIFVRVTETLDSPVSVTIISPENKVTGGFGFSIPRKDIESSERQKHSMLQMVGRVSFNAPIEGTYWFDVSFEGKSLGGSPLVVEFRDVKELEDGITRGNA